MAKRLQTYEAPGITVTFDPNVCSHGGTCIRGLPEVFDLGRKRWIRPELATPEAVAAQVARCPSGALQFQRPGEIEGVRHVEARMTTKLGVGVFVFDDVEVLDFAGPFEVFSRTRLTPGLDSRRSEDSAPFNVFTVAPRPGPVVATGGLTIAPHFDFSTAPPIDVVVVPGGFGTRPLLADAEVLAWLRRTAKSARRVTSVCTGSLLLAQAGLLAGRRATTHWSALDRLAGLDASITVDGNQRFVDDGIVTSAGVSAGIDMAFSVVAAFCGREVAQETARYIEYPYWNG